MLDKLVSAGAASSAKSTPSEDVVAALGRVLVLVLVRVVVLVLVLVLVLLIVLGTVFGSF